MAIADRELISKRSSCHVSKNFLTIPVGLSGLPLLCNQAMLRSSSRQAEPCTAGRVGADCRCFLAPSYRPTDLKDMIVIQFMTAGADSASQPPSLCHTSKICLSSHSSRCSPVYEEKHERPACRLPCDTGGTPVFESTLKEREVK